MQGSKYQPSKQSEFSAKDLNLDFKGTAFTIPKTTVTNCDALITDDSIIDGGRVIAAGVAQGDYVACQVVDKDNVLGYGAGAVLNQFVTQWYLAPGAAVAWDFTATYPAKLYAGLYVRVIYTSVGTVDDVWMAVNLKLHKILW